MLEILNEKEKQGVDIYKFQEIKINNINCLLEIHMKKKIFVVKCKNIFVLFDNNYKSRYILNHKTYHNLEELLFYINEIHDCVIYNGLLLKGNEKKRLITENKFLKRPISNCSVCYEETNELTKCNHILCMSCRETILISDNINNKKCPICRNTSSVEFIKFKDAEIYNNIHQELNIINNEEILENTFDNRYLHANERIINDMSPVLQMLLVREIINSRVTYPTLIIYSYLRLLYNNKWSISFTIASSILLYFQVKRNYTIYNNFDSFNDNDNII